MSTDGKRNKEVRNCATQTTFTKFEPLLSVEHCRMRHVEPVVRTLARQQLHRSLATGSGGRERVSRSRQSRLPHLARHSCTDQWSLSAAVGRNSSPLPRIIPTRCNRQSFPNDRTNYGRELHTVRSQVTEQVTVTSYGQKVRS